MANVSVLIVSYLTPRLTAAAAESALRDSNICDVVIVDNAADDATRIAVETLADDRVRYVQSAENVGFGTAANQAATLARGSILLFLNSDAELQPGCVAALIDEVGGSDGRCLVGARLIGPDGIQPSAGLLPAPTDLVARGLGLHAIAFWLRRWRAGAWVIDRTRLSREHASAASAVRAIDTSMVSGACFAIRRDAFFELAGFDERFFLYFEDADLCRRALRAGMPIRYCPDAIVSHIGGASSSEDYHLGPRHARSMRQYLTKWYGPPGAALAVVLMLIRAIGFTIGGPRRSGRAWRALAATLGFGGGRP